MKREERERKGRSHGHGHSPAPPAAYELGLSKDPKNSSLLAADVSRMDSAPRPEDILIQGAKTS